MVPMREVPFHCPVPDRPPWDPTATARDARQLLASVRARFPDCARVAHAGGERGEEAFCQHCLRDLSKKDAIVAFLEECPGSELQEIAAAIGEGSGKVSVHLSQLKRQGRVNNQARKWAPASYRETSGT